MTFIEAHKANFFGRWECDFKLNENMKTIKKYETCGTKHKDCKCCLEYTNIKYDLILCKCLCNRNHQKKFNERLNKRLVNGLRTF